MKKTYYYGLLIIENQGLIYYNYEETRNEKFNNLYMELLDY